MNSTAALNVRHKPRSVLVLAGTTASGKTAVSIPLAEALQGEIISADSRQIFRELDIGTAKPTPEQRARVPHHFVDECSIHSRWTAGDFARSGRARIEEILARNRTPLVVGGSMLYLRALLDGFFEAAPEPHIDYAPLRAEWQQRGAQAMYEELTLVDPQLAARTHVNDHHRILRALAYFRSTGTALSSHYVEKTAPFAHPFTLFFLYGDRAETYARADRRAQDMVHAGLVDEVRGLYAQGLHPQNCRALATHGYQEVFPYLRGEIDADTMLADIQKAVRHYIKRQVTWFRHEPRALWIERKYDQPDSAVADRILADFKD